MLENMPTTANPRAASQQRELKALLRLVNDLGYEVQTTDKGTWVVSTSDDRGDRAVVGVDDANEVAAAARQLAEMLHIDQPAHVCATAR